MKRLRIALVVSGFTFAMFAPAMQIDTPPKQEKVVKQKVEKQVVVKQQPVSEKVKAKSSPGATRGKAGEPKAQ